MPDSGGDVLPSTAPMERDRTLAECVPQGHPFPLTRASPVQAPIRPQAPLHNPQLPERRGATQRALLSSCVCSGRLILGAQLMTCGWPGDPGDWC